MKLLKILKSTVDFAQDSELPDSELPEEFLTKDRSKRLLPWIRHSKTSKTFEVFTFNNILDKLQSCS